MADADRDGADVRLGTGWVLRWDTVADERPRVRHAPARTGLAGASRASGRGEHPLGAPGQRGAPSLWRGSTRDFVVFDGYLFDRPSGAGESLSDAALVARAHARRPEALLDVIAGGFALCLWDETRRRLIVARDALGLATCFYAWDGRVLLVAASVDALLARPEVDRTFGRAVIAEFLQNQHGSHRMHETFYAGIHRVPAAHALRVERGRMEATRYWDPVPADFDWATSREIAGFGDRLERAVERCLAAGADSIALSGGFDSVSLAALAAAARGDHLPLRALSLRFAGSVCDEGPSQTAVARALGMPQLLCTLDEALDGRDLVAAALEGSRASPSPILSPWQSAYTGLFQAASRFGVTRVLMGTGGDDLLNVDPSYGRDRLAALDFRGLWRFCRACQRTSPFSAARVMRGVLWDHAAFPALLGLGARALGSVSPSALEHVRQRRRRGVVQDWAWPTDGALAPILEQRYRRAAARLAPGDRAYLATLRQITVGPLYLIERDQSAAWADQVGFTFLFPFLDRDLVALSLRIPPEELIAGGRHKAPLRRLVAARLPAVAMRPKKVDFTPAVHEVLRPAVRRLWRSAGGGAMLAELGLVDAARLDRFMEDYGAGRNARWLGAWLAFSTEAWLRARRDLSFTPGEEVAA